MNDYEEFYNKIDNLFYNKKIKKDSIENLYDSVECVFEELSELRERCIELSNDYHELRSDFDTVDYENSVNIERVSDLETLINKYKEIIKRFAPEELI
jgi:archaellum component FlaC